MQIRNVAGFEITQKKKEKKNLMYLSFWINKLLKDLLGLKVLERHRYVCIYQIMYVRMYVNV